MTDYSDSDLDPFWVKNRAEFLAAKSTKADPSACGTCRGNAEAGEPVEHDGCAQRATLLQAPGHPYYEILAGFSLEENAKLPARFHIPVFDDCGKPNAWLCAVCQEEGQVVGWPCATAVKYGTQVFTPLHEAETAQKKQVAEVDEMAREIEQLKAERDRYRTAYHSASFRAEARGEGIVRIVGERESYQGWLKQEQECTQRLRAELDRAREDIAFLERNTLPELRREVEHHKDGKERWRKRAEKAEPERDALQQRLNQAAMTRTWRNEDGKKFVFVEDIAPALLGIELKPEATS
jgi:hypothetical protein